VDAYDRTVATLKRRIEYVDLRYANGFAVRIPELAGNHAQPPRGAERTKGKARKT
jgi:cell division septal protein FtsQ